MRLINKLWPLFAAVCLGACTLTGNPVTPTPAMTPTSPATGRPEVIINSPNNGNEVNVGDDVLVQATATDSAGVTSVQLFANDVLVKTTSSESPTGDTRLPVVLDYTTRSAGEVTLEVVAFRGTVSSDPASVTISVLEEDDPIEDPVEPPNNGPVIDPNDPTCRALTNVGLNFRTGPSTVYDRITTLAAGTVAPIVGRVGDNSWWQLQVGVTRGWVSADFTTEYGFCASVPIVPAPPTPTSGTPTDTPTPTLTPTPTSTPTPTNTPLPQPADLVVSNVTGPQSITLGAGGSTTTTYSAQITNTGGTESGQFDTQATVSPGAGTIPLSVVANLRPGESINLNFEVTFDAVGTYSIQVQTDVSDNVDEQSEVNNIGILSNITVGS